MRKSKFVASFALVFLLLILAIGLAAILRENYRREMDMADAMQVLGVEALTLQAVFPLWLRDSFGIGNTYPSGLYEVAGVRLDSQNVTDADASEVIEHLRKLRKLRGVSLNDNPLTDNSLCDVATLDQIESLWLEGTRISDVGLQRLHGLHNLKHLYIGRTEVTDVGVAKLKESLPNLNVAK